MKVVEFNWSFMTNTVCFPVIKGGKVVSATAYEKGQGQWGGRFPTAFAVVTDEAVVEHVRRGRCAEAENPTEGRVWQGCPKDGRPGVKCPEPVMFRWADRAKKVAEEWARR